MSKVIIILAGALLFHVLPAWGQGVHDLDMPEVGQLQNARLTLAPLPRGFDGRPDWVKGLKNGQIEPRETKWGLPREPEEWGPGPKDGIVFRNTLYMPFVVFPHQPHTEWLACNNCHDDLFPRKKTGQLKGMTAIFQGEYCGVCHGKVAFAPEGSCYRCHSMANPMAQQQGSPFVEPLKAEAPEGEEDDGGRKSRRQKKSGGLPGGLRPAVPLP